uniref:N-acyl-aliphatic-L-amino acid amidohydrolase n=1 Tax=Glossina pallidipes TaxID=7398 RepID=A0A1B0A2Y1_GLOPL
MHYTRCMGDFKFDIWVPESSVTHSLDYLSKEKSKLLPTVVDGSCVEFLTRQADMLDLPAKVYYPANKENPVVVISWYGTDQAAKSILLNSHMDVVPVYPENWTHPPFAAEMDNQGRIYARGSQDMKSVGMQYLAALRALRKQGLHFKRTIHLTFVPDEEMGGRLGMKPFVETGAFKSLNIGFALDEGLASPNEEFALYNSERSVWRVYFQISGNAGHGSLLLPKTPGEKLFYILDKMMTYRTEQVKRLESDGKLKIGDVTTINLTKISGGVQSNVIPPKMTLCFDIRLALDVDHKQFECKLEKLCEEAGGDIKVEYEQKQPRIEPTATNDTNPYWVAFKKATDEMNLKIVSQVFPGGTDSRYIRALGIPAIGFSPMNNTPVLLHDHDEFIAADVYLKGIQIYQNIIKSLANS